MNSIFQDAEEHSVLTGFGGKLSPAVTLMGNSNSAGPSTRGSSARAMIQLCTAEGEVNKNLRLDFPLLRLITLH